jgi:hypothetical protein
MPTSNFQIWDQSQTNIQADGSYGSDPQRLNGAAVNGLFGSPLANKLFYQLSVMVAAIGQAMVAKGYDTLDSNFTNLVTSLENILTHNDVPGYLVTMSQFTAGQNSNGFWELSPSGLLVQMGTTASITNGTHASQNFPIPFPSHIFGVVLSANRLSGGNSSLAQVDDGTISLSGFSWGLASSGSINGNGTACYFAAGS